MENEKYELKLSEIKNKLNLSRAFRSGLEVHAEDYEEADEAEESEEVHQVFGRLTNRDQSHHDLRSPSSSSENNSYRDETDNEFNERYFYVDKYEDSQLKMLIKAFVVKVMIITKDVEGKLTEITDPTNYAIPSKLWVEKQGATTEKDASYHFVSTQGPSDDRITDFIEDTIDATSENRLKESGDHLYSYAAKQVGKFNERKLSDDLLDSHDESEYLIFERHFESQPFSSSEEEKESEKTRSKNVLEKDPIFEDELNTEDLGIIDLEDDDVFDNIDDDKLPFLKNTYSKKNRPNNSKSVAAGSKSKANRIDFGREDVGPDTTPKARSEESTPEKEFSQIKPEEDLQVNEIAELEEEPQPQQPPLPEEQMDSDEDVGQAEQESEEDEEEDDINKYLDFEDDGDEEDDILEPHKGDSGAEPIKQKKDETVEEIDVFDICTERKMTGDSDEKEEEKTEVLRSEQIYDLKIISPLTFKESKEENKTISKELLINKKVKKNKNKGNLGQDKDYELSIKTSVPQINTKNIVRNKVLSTSKSTNLQSQSQIVVNKEDDEFFSNKTIPETQIKKEESEQPSSAPLREPGTISISLEENKNKYED